MEKHEVNMFWKRIVDTINDGLMFIAPDGSIRMVNKAFEHLTGYSSDEITGMSCRTLACDACEKIMGTDGETAWCVLFEEGGQGMKKCRCHIMRRDGSFLPVLKNAAVLRDENGIILGVAETITDISELTKLDEKVQILSKQFAAENDFFGMVGKSAGMQAVFDMIRKASRSNAPVIVYGESGTGKELVANAIHFCGDRKDQPFISLNCAALNETILESELFGHAKGSFTGAYHNRIGRFEAANHGDFFLDEIGDMPLSLQIKILRVLESGSFERMGDISPICVNVRIITATNKNLEELVESNAFRQDLYFRINVIPIFLPPLRNRTEDIPLLMNAFIHRLNESNGAGIQGTSREAMDMLMQYSWPGNVRELRNTMEYAFVTCGDSTIEAHHLPRRIRHAKNGTASYSAAADAMDPIPDEKHLLIKALQAASGNQTQAAKILNVNRVTVWNRMRKYGINLKKELAAESDR